MTGVLFWLASAGHMAEASCLRIRTWKCQKPLRKVTTGARVQARERNWYCCTSWPGDGPFGVKEGECLSTPLPRASCSWQMASSSTRLRPSSKLSPAKSEGVVDDLYTADAHVGDAPTRVTDSNTRCLVQTPPQLSTRKTKKSSSKSNVNQQGISCYG
jgi:hypothetical protein